MSIFVEKPGMLFVLATILPMVSFLILLLRGMLWSLARRYRDAEHPNFADNIYHLLGGDTPSKVPAFVALAAIALAFVCSATGAVMFMQDHGHYNHTVEILKDEIHDLEHNPTVRAGKTEQQLKDEIHTKETALHGAEKDWAEKRGLRWKGKLFTLVKIHAAAMNDSTRGAIIDIGYAIDSLSVTMFVMVTFIATLIHLFSMGYMSEELAPQVEDHHVHSEHGHFHRRGRFGRFFMYLSLFCFSMLNLILADNLFQVFVSWELVGICSFLLIGFYYERQSASNAANKAFITNRVGDAGFILGLLIIWGYFGTFNFESTGHVETKVSTVTKPGKKDKDGNPGKPITEEVKTDKYVVDAHGIFDRVRSPVYDAHGHLGFAGKIVRGEPIEPLPSAPDVERLRITQPEDKEKGSQVVIYPRLRKGHYHGIGPRHDHDDEGEGHAPAKEIRAPLNPEKNDYTSMPYWMLVVAGLGIFLGCVGKSAQFPLQVWLPDAMEGPTPVSALIHAATMVAAGVYLVGRCYPLFTPEVLLVIAYTGGITLFVAATIAIVMTDIKKVLAYSTVSQLGYMMLALGVGGWVAGLFHLVTHAFFKALLFLGSGSVIYGCHHEQEMTQMGGLYKKMKITAITMLMGVLAIAGIPLFSGWYSKDSILAHAIGFVYVHPQHILLFVLPLLTAGITTFYMFRMWFLTFTGEPRNDHVHEHAHESPWMMTTPLIILGVLSVCIAWGWPIHDATASKLEHTIKHSMPDSVMADFGHVHDEAHPAHSEHWHPIAAKPVNKSERHFMHELHNHAGFLALGMVAVGIVFALVTYYYRVLDAGEAKEQFPRLHAFLTNKWYFDEMYSVLLVRPAIIVARAFRAFDMKVLDGTIHALARGTLFVAWTHGKVDNGFVDWLVNLVANTTYGIGQRFRNVQTGYLRSYILFLALAAIGLVVLLTYFVAMANAG